jgi:hypothetical protein
MKNRKSFPINYSSVDSQSVLKKVNRLLEDATPNNILGMLALANTTGSSIVFYDRWELTVSGRNDYAVIDLYTKNTIYEGIALFSSALAIVYNINKKISRSCPLDQIIYKLDQEYYRCLDQIRFYQKKLKENKSSDTELFAIKLIDKRHRLHEIKCQLSKVY